MAKEDAVLAPPHELEVLNIDEFADMVKRRRGTTSLRFASQEAGVSFSTLSRVESGSCPDLASFTRICAWLGVPPSRFFVPVAERRMSGLDSAIAHLSSDPNLSAEAKKSIADVLQRLYENLAAHIEPDSRVIACHLRAASVLRPGVPQRLSTVLRKIEDGLLDLDQRGEL